jgi:PKD repeat protein
MKKRLVLLVLVAALGFSLVGCTEWMANVVPNAAITVTNGVDKFTFTFDGRGSSDTDGTVETWGWTFGDGGTAYGEIVEHTYAVDGTYIVNLTVTDDQGAQGSVAITVLIQGEAPIALFFANPHNVQTGEQVVFNGEDSYDPDGEIDRATWDFGDGMTLTGWWEDVQIVNHIYGTIGLYTITLTVTDEDDMTGTVTHEVRVHRP